MAKISDEQRVAILEYAMEKYGDAIVEAAMLDQFCSDDIAVRCNAMLALIGMVLAEEGIQWR